MKEESKKVFRALVRQATNEQFITYGDLAAVVNEKNVTAESLRIYLGEVATFCKENKIPIITSVVVNKDSRTPGLGFYDNFKKGHGEDLDYWIEQLKKTFKYDWLKISI